MLSHGSIDCARMGGRPKASPAAVSADPLFSWFDASPANRAKLRAAGYTDGRITNWRRRGIPRAQVGDVAGLMGLTFEQYMARAGVRHHVADPQQQYTLEADALMLDFLALPEGLREHVARKTAELRAYAQGLPSFLREALKPPADAERYRAWERDIEAAMLNLRSTPPPRAAKTAPQARRRTRRASRG